MGNLGQYLDNGGIDPSTVEPGNDFSPIPAGWYPVEVESAEIKDTKTGNGKMLKLMLNVIGEKFNGRKLFVSLNIVNPSEKAQEIGRRELADLARACDIPFLDDEDKLLGKKCLARVVVKQDAGFEPDNEVKAYKPLDGKAPAPAQKQAPAAEKPAPAAPEKKAAATEKKAPAQAAKPAGGKMPWER